MIMTPADSFAENDYAKLILHIQQKFTSLHVFLIYDYD